ncbi:phosphatase PAP2 family protein [Brevibacterium sp. 91QC2O2]|uniref:phosphatase PAP2 family protein n=1 Tax=Brevibacterium sp. 91QC2O2 TaxID=2968458 RepID=UPI00211CB80B|nr:phosphatase PAP2 family protein [Brevibacterium sp. 91QC2O2]MCQ9368634.1 phosphatase PAP2 family protein [Brevibacterium sp. 91QC2O2]
MLTPHSAKRIAAIGTTVGIMFAGTAVPATAAGLGTAAPGDTPSHTSTATDTATAPTADATTSTKAPTAPPSTAGAPAEPTAKAAKVDENVELMREFDDYWTPLVYDDSTADTKRETGFRGSVTAHGAPILGANDDLYKKINTRAAKDTEQAHRALVDADYDWKETLPDSLGPVLAEYFSEGVEGGELDRAAKAFDGVLAESSTGAAKPYFNYPRPFLSDRGFAGQKNENDLRGLAPDLETARIPDWTDAHGRKHTADYNGMAEGISQAFPSGHTTFAYEETLLLAVLLPELGPEIATRGSEAGNNRIALGVHYPLDVIGGRILGHAHTAATLDAKYIENTLQPARKQLVDYLTDRCEADGYGDTLAACITATKANGTGGYANAFTDAVATVPVTDRSSALQVYRERMTYGFDRATSYTGGTRTADEAPRVPAGAANLLVTTFPELNEEQRTAVLAATEAPAGYPLDSSSRGWARIDLPAAQSAKVTLDEAGTVTKVEPGQPAASVVTAGRPSASTEPSDSPSAPSATTAAPAPGGDASGDGGSEGDNAGGGEDTGALPTTGTELGLPVGIGAVLVIGGATVLLTVRRRRNRAAAHR